MTPDRKELIEFYKITVDEEHKALESHQNRVAFITGLLSAILTVTVAGAFKATTQIHYAFLEFGPLIIVLLCALGIRVSRQFYARFLSAITMRAKIEQILGLTSPCSGIEQHAGCYWQDEPIIPQRHLKSRRGKPNSSEAWTDSKMKEGYQRSASLLFGVGIVVAVLLSLLILYLYFSYAAPQYLHAKPSSFEGKRSNPSHPAQLPKLTPRQFE